MKIRIENGIVTFYAEGKVFMTTDWEEGYFLLKDLGICADQFLTNGKYEPQMKE